MDAKSRSRRGPAIALSLALVPLLALGDVVTGADASFTLLYGVAIATATWFASRGWGIAVSLASAVASIVADAIARSAVADGAAACAAPPKSTAALAWNVAVQLCTFLLFVVLLDALRRQLERERVDARTDGLTSLANRRAFIEAMALEAERARRHGHPVSLAYVDLDGFKAINDQRGHAEGDAVLVSVARTLRAGTRAFDVVGRLGGDEFGLLLPETDALAAGPFLARLRGELEAAMRYHGWRVGFSAGVVTWTRPPESVAEMLRRADALMYGAKEEGKGVTRFEAIDAEGRPAPPERGGPPGNGSGGSPEA